MSRKPSVVIIPTSAPACVSTMFVATVVPWRRLSTSSSGTPAFLTEAANALDDAPRRVVGRRGHLVDGDAPRLLIDEDEIGEGPADVDADALHAVVLASAGTISRPTRRIWSTCPLK